MAAGRIFLPSWMPALNADGAPIPASLYIYENKTDILATVYSDATLTTPLANPVVANSSGRFPQMWQDSDELFSISVDAPYGPPGIPFTYDDVSPSITADTAAVILAGGYASDARDYSIEAGSAATTAGLAEDAANEVLEQIEAIVAGSPDAPSVLNKADRDLSNVTDRMFIIWKQNRILCDLREENTASENDVVRAAAVAEAQGATLILPPGLMAVNAFPVLGVREVVAYPETILDFSGKSSTGKCLHVSGFGQADKFGVPAVRHTLAADVAVGEGTCVVAASTGLASGVKVLLRSDQKDYLAPGFESQTFGEIKTIKSVTGTGPYTVEFTAEARLPYTTSFDAEIVVVDYAPPCTMVGNGALIRGSGDTHTNGGLLYGDRGLVGDWCENFQAYDWRVEKCDRFGILPDNCEEFTIERCNVAMRSYAPPQSVCYQYAPYGVTNKGTIHNCRGTGGSSGVCHTGSGTDGFMFDYTISDTVVENAADGFGEHSGLFNATYLNVTAQGCKRGFGTRGRQRTFISPKILNCYDGVGGDGWSFSESPGDITIVDMHVENVRRVLTSSGSNMAKDQAPFRISIIGGTARGFNTGLTFEQKGGLNKDDMGGYNTTIGGDISIEGLKLYCTPPNAPGASAASSLPIQVSGYWNDLFVSDCRIQFDTANYPMVIRGVENIVLSNNVFKNSRGVFIGANSGGESVIDSDGNPLVRNPAFASVTGCKWIGGIQTDVVPIVTVLTAATTKIVQHDNHASNVEFPSAWATGASVALTIASGAITLPVTGAAMVVVDTEGGAATDDLETINGGRVGDVLVIRQAHNNRDVTLVRTVTGEGKIIPGSANVALTTVYDQVTLRKNAEGVWTAIADINNG